MTSEEIRRKQTLELSTGDWLKEICLQLALLNEKQPAQPVQSVPQRQNLQQVRR